MTQENKEQSEFPQENHSEKQDNRLPYEPPTLRKHGKINNTTKSTFFFPDIDGLGLNLTDFS